MSEFNSYLAENPRKIGVLFALLTMLASTGTASAAGIITLSGP